MPGRCTCTLLLGAWLLAPLEGAAQAPPTYPPEVAAIITDRCVICHNGEGAPLGLRLDTLDGLRAGSTKGPVAIPGDADASELVKRIRGESLPRMPLTGPPYLADGQIARIARWIDDGMPASGPAGGGSPQPGPTGPPALPASGEPVTFAHVEPILLQRCVKCHTDEGLRGPPPEGLRLKTYDLVLRGGDRVVVIPGQPGVSELVRRITGKAQPRMPFDGPPYLSDEQSRVITEWVAQGARDAGGNAAPIPVGARVRLHGTLTGRWELDGQPLRVGPGARIKDRVAVGEHVRVRGTVGPAGEIAVERIQRR